MLQQHFRIVRQMLGQSGQRGALDGGVASLHMHPTSMQERRDDGVITGSDGRHWTGIGHKKCGCGNV
jgi:hypothetical protein